MLEPGAVPSTVSDLLARDHARLDGRLADARRLAGDGKPLDAVTAFDDFVQGLEHHILIEEDVLFPTFEARVHLSGPTAVMRHEHRILGRLLPLARAALVGGDRLGFVGICDEIAAALAAHNMKEEHIIYPRTDAALSDDERAALVQRLVVG